jgi:16S rRNA G1207 methylase RsmC
VPWLYFWGCRQTTQLERLTRLLAEAVLLSAVLLMGENTEVIKRWENEVKEAVQSKHTMVQCHAVALLHALRASDRLAISKLVTTLTASKLWQRTPLTTECS